jgi:succinate dehydrogenase flavin-adding protein (antitoxin of CptAB toxin-antitoxin module)
MKELYVVLERFARHALPDASAGERLALEDLLALPDPLLAAYLLGGDTPPEPHLAVLTGAIRLMSLRGVPRRYSEGVESGTRPPAAADETFG